MRKKTESSINTFDAIKKRICSKYKDGGVFSSLDFIDITKAYTNPFNMVRQVFRSLEAKNIIVRVGEIHQARGGNSIKTYMLASLAGLERQDGFGRVTRAVPQDDYNTECYKRLTGALNNARGHAHE